MGKNEMLFIVLVLIIAACTIHILSFIDFCQKQYRNDLRKHQEWLFQQLYALGPGKVLRPDEMEPAEEKKPAKVYHPSRDPMNEFNGKMNDWA